MIDTINTHRTHHILTAEDPIEFVLPNKKCIFTQREIGTHANSFADALRVASREDPDIILVGEMRDQETISLASIIREGKISQIESLIQTGTKAGMQTMDQHLMELVQEERITREAAYEKATKKQLFESRR